MLLNVCGAVNVQPESDAATVYVLPEVTANEYLPLASVVAFIVSPPVSAMLAPWSAPLGPVTVPEIVSAVAALDDAVTWSSPPPSDPEGAHPTAASVMRSAGTSATPRNDCECSKPLLNMFYPPQPVTRG
jgi:hypothetical protein